MRENVSYLQLEKIINHYYITTKEVAILANCNIKYARNIANEIKREMEDAGIPVVTTKPLRVPTERVLKKLHISSEKIRKEAEGIRKSGRAA